MPTPATPPSSASPASIVETRWAELSPLLDALLDLPPGQREAWIDANSPDPELAAALRKLAADADRESVIDTGSDAIARSLLTDDERGSADDVDVDVTAFPAWIGRRLGTWRIESLLGEGGMASVFLARRDDGGYDQSVALKVLRQGVLDPYEQQRFLRERQILARLEHPRIARLIDGGVTPEGVPWFAMEYVPGTEITTYCDQRRLTVDARLRLFLDVCDAVAHAHRALVVHRDLKPSNILVTDAGELRLLDFGIASLAAPEGMAAAGAATVTVAARRRLTPAYAAPEQWQDGPVTTSADVYALGVLLHELLTGQRPNVREDGSVRRASAQWTTTGVAATAAAYRASTPARLRRHVAGDLDRIIEVALHRDPGRRYASVTAFADDIRRHLDRRPVRARADGATYRLGRFLRRNRAGVLAASLLLASIVTGAAISLRQATLTRQALVQAQAEAERANAVRDFLVGIFAGAAPNQTQGAEVSAAELLDRGARGLDERMADVPSLRAELQLTLAGIYRELGRYDNAEALLAQVSTVDGIDRTALELERARIAFAAGRYEAAERAVAEALDRLPAAELPRRAELLAFQAEVLVARNRNDEADAAIREAIGIVRTQAQVDPVVLAHHTAVLGQIAFARGEMEVADAAASEALALRIEHLGALHTDVATVQHDLGVIQLQQGRLDEAQATFEAALATRRQLLGPAHVDLASTLQNLGATRRAQGERDTARVHYVEAAQMLETLFPDGHPALGIAYNSLAVLTQEQGRLDEATDWLEKAIGMSRKSLGDGHPSVAVMLGNQASILRLRGLYDRAEAVQREGLALLESSVGKRHHLYGVALVNLGFIALDGGNASLGLERFNEAGEVIRQALGAEHPDYSAVLTGISEARLASGDTRGALDAALDAAAIVDKALPADHPRTRRTRVTLAEAHLANGDCGAAGGIVALDLPAASGRDRTRL